MQELGGRPQAWGSCSSPFPPPPPSLQPPPAHVSGRVLSLSAAWALLSIRPAGLDIQTQSAGTPGKGPAWLAGPPYFWALVSPWGCCGAAPHGCGAGPGTQLPSATCSACDRVLEAGFVLSVLFPGRRSVGLLPPAPLTAHLCFPRLEGEAPCGHVGGQCWLKASRQPRCGEAEWGASSSFQGRRGGGGVGCSSPLPTNW